MVRLTNKRILSKPDEIDEDGLVKLRVHPEMDGRGIYIISIADGTLDYPKKPGQVIYIGKATSGTTIKSRLKDHRSRNNNPNMYSYFKYKQLKIQYVHMHSADRNLTAREKNRFQDHFDEYGCAPVANRQGISGLIIRHNH